MSGKILDFGFYNMDCMEGMREFPDKYFDLAIVDPPYGHGKSIISNNKSRTKLAIAKDYGEGKWNNNIPNQEYFDELFRVSKNQIIWGINYYPYYFGAGRIVWDKDNGKNDFSDCELAYQSFTNSVRKFKWRWNGMLQQNMKNKEQRIHPTQKPIALYRWILQNYAKPGDIILDTHVGSASSLIACEMEGFKYVGFEIDEEYYKKAYQRLVNYRKQLILFTAEDFKSVKILA